jgi:hypothetical protein
MTYGGLVTDLTNNVLAVVKFNRVTGIARDEVENTFWFAAVGAGMPAYGDTLAAHIAAYYNTATLDGSKVGSFLNETISRTVQHQISFYDAIPLLTPGGVTGPPLQIHDFTLVDPLSANCLPDTTAIGLSFHGDLTGVPENSGATRPRARRRGRIFIGPLIVNAAVIDSSSGVARPADTAMSAIQERAVDLAGDLGDDGVAAWSVFSRKDLVFYPITGGWVDDRFDNQRRRDIDATRRIVFTV